MPHVSAGRTQPTIKLKPKVKTPVQWVQASLDALCKDIGTQGFMALGQLCEWLNCYPLAQRCYLVGSRSNPMFFHMLGDSFVDTQADKALGYYQAALAQSKQQNTLLGQSNTAEPNLLKKMAKVYSKKQQWSEATACLETVLESTPDDFDTMFHLAEVSVLMNNWFKAMYYCKEGLNHDPRNAILWGHLGFAMYRLEDTEGSLKAYQTAFQFGKDNLWKSQVAQTLGQLVYQQGGQTAEALNYFKQAIQLNPNNSDAVEMVAEMALKQNQIQEALEAYNQLLTLTPGRTDVYCALGYVLWQLDRNEEAVDAYLAAIHLDSKNAVALNNLGVIYLDEEHLPLKALTLFQEAFRLNPDYTLARFNEGRCLEQLGHIHEAAQAFSQSKQLNETNPELDEYEIDERLNRLFLLER
jgi:tetratricopeptide (TPR) repeat protein